MRKLPRRVYVTIAAVVGSQIAHYRVLEKLGQGGMGEVYRAHDTRLQRDVALKVLPLRSVDDPAARQQLLREARTASALTHPHICAVFDAGESEGQIYIALELVRGKPLNEIIPPGGMATESVARYGAQIADALSHAHAEGIVHRDLKSGNVMVAGTRAKVLDFGLAVRTRQAAATATTVAEADSATGGTLAYMAPEVLAGAAADASSDIWALGVVLYEMATGRRPFDGRTAHEISSAILRDQAAPLPAHMPAALRTVILRCLAKEPAQRYRSAGEVQAVLEAIAAGGQGPVPEVQITVAPPARPTTPRAFIAASIIVAAILLAVAVIRPRWQFRSSPSAPGVQRIASIAVLPLENMSGDSEQDYFADGMTEMLIASLAQIRALKVISRTSAMRFKGSGRAGKSLPQIARDLEVDAVVEGSVQRSGNRVRVTAQLIHAATDAHLWAGTYERDMSDVLRIQSEVAAAIANEIRVNVTPGERARLYLVATGNPEAQEAYLRARYHLRRLNDYDLSKAIEYFARAIQIEPANARAYGGLTEAWIERGVWGGVPFREVEKHARAAAQQALQHDPNVSETRAALAHILYVYDWNWTASEAEFQRALEINPNNVEAHHYFAVMLHAVGAMERAVSHIERARERDPVSAVVESTYGRILYRARRYKEALQHLERARELDPGLYGIYVRMADVYEAMGDYDRAMELQQKTEVLEASARQAGAAPARYSAGRARLLALMGRRAEALAELNAIVKGSPERLNAWGIATAYAALGDNDQAFAWLNRAIERRDLVVFTKTEPKFETLHSDPRWAATLRRINLTP